MATTRSFITYLIACAGLACPALFASQAVAGNSYKLVRAGEGRHLETGDIVEFHRVLRSEDGAVLLDSRAEGKPLLYYQGWRHMHPDKLLELIRTLRVGDVATATMINADASAGRNHITNLAPGAGIHMEVEILRAFRTKLASIVWETINSKGIVAARAELEAHRVENFAEVFAGPGELDYLATGFLFQLNRIPEAIALFTWNCELFSENAALRESLAEAFYVDGNRSEAVKTLEIALKMDPTLEGAKRMLMNLQNSPASPTPLDRLKLLLRSAGAFGSPPFNELPPNLEYLQQKVDELLLDSASIDPPDRIAIVESLVRVAYRSKAADGERVMARYKAHIDPPVRDAASKLILSLDNARKAREATAANKTEMLSKPVDLRFRAMDGREVDITQLRGTVVLIDFWATWCGPCIEEIPNVVVAYNKYRDKGFEVVGISLDRANKSESEILEFCRRYQITWPQCFDVKRGENTFAKQFGIEAIPAMLLLDQNGMIVSTNARGSKLEAEVKRLLGL